MTRDDIINMAKEAGVLPNFEVYVEDLERFAALVAAVEREACAVVCMSEGNDIYADRYYNEATFVCAAKIRDRTTP